MGVIFIQKNMQVHILKLLLGFPGGSVSKRIHLQCRYTWVRSLSGEDLLEKERATHSSILAWEIPWAEECGML